jgi:hypothetical protein
MKKGKLAISIALIFTLSLFAKDNNKADTKEQNSKKIEKIKSPEELFKDKCAGCHISTTPTRVSTLTAPPIIKVMMRVKKKYSKKEEAIAFIKDYVINPSRDKALCMPHSINKFGLMPSLKNLITTKELDILLPWIYDKFPPKNFKKMKMVGDKEPMLVE